MVVHAATVGAPGLPTVRWVNTDEAAVLAANQAFYDAFEARDFDALSDLWERSERISCTHRLADIARLGSGRRVVGRPAVE